MLTGIFPPDAGGPATYVPALAQTLQKKGHEVTVLTASEAENLGLQAPEFTFRVERICRRPPLSRTLRLILRLVRLGQGVQLIYANGFFAEAAIANLVCRKPLVMKLVGDEAWERATHRGWTTLDFEGFQDSQLVGFKAGLLKLLRNWSVGRAKRVIVPSKYLARWIKQWHVREERIQVVYNAVKAPGKELPNRLTLPPSLRVVTVGRLVPWKHHAEVIRAVAETSDLSLVMVGDGPERKRLEQLSKASNAGDRILFLGQRSRSEVWGILARCDIFVLNSSYEGLPHVLLEAMTLALPVIATRVGGVPEIVEDGKDGILIAPGSLRGLSKALKQLAGSSRLREALGRAAQRKAALFGSDVMSERTEKVLKDALA